MHMVYVSVLAVRVEGIGTTCQYSLCERDSLTTDVHGSIDCRELKDVVRVETFILWGKRSVTLEWEREGMKEVRK